MNNEKLVTIKEALRIVALEEITAIDRIIANAPNPPDEVYIRCDERAQEIINKQKKSMPLRKAISILVAATLIISLLAVVAYATKNKIGGFFVDFFEKYAELTPDDNLGNTTNPSDVSISYIPNEFTETRRKIGAKTALYEWTKEEAVITFQIRVITKSSTAIDTENSNYTVIDIGGITLHRRNKLGQINVTWTDEKMVYSLACRGVEWDEIVNIVKGVKLNNASN